MSSDTGSSASELLFRQKTEWNLLGKNYKDLEKVITKELHFQHSEITLQYNPNRIKSTTARTDELSIKERACFLCSKNRPEQQRAVSIRDWEILCNPYPIFPEHFTIVHKHHIPQRIGDNFYELLILTKELGGRYSVIYNGPECGASAPDHLHFQAGTLNYLPIEKEILKTEVNSDILLIDQVSISFISDELRKMILLKSNKIEELNRIFQKLYNVLNAVSPSELEPKLNIISWFSEEAMHIIIIPRTKHRSHHYFSEENRIILSPASVDIGGICVVPLPDDFNKVNEDTIKEIFKEVMLSHEQMGNVKALFKQNIRL